MSDETTPRPLSAAERAMTKEFIHSPSGRQNYPLLLIETIDRYEATLVALAAATSLRWREELATIADLDCFAPFADPGATPGDATHSCFRECISCQARRAVEAFGRPLEDDYVAELLALFRKRTFGWYGILGTEDPVTLDLALEALVSAATFAESAKHFRKWAKELTAEPTPEAIERVGDLISRTFYGSPMKDLLRDEKAQLCVVAARLILRPPMEMTPR